MHSLRNVVALFALILLAVPAVAQEEVWAPFSEIKQSSDGVVQEAIGLLSSSDMNGTLNRLSALFDRAKVRDLGEDDGSQLDAKVITRVDLVLEDLQIDIEAAIIDLDAMWADCGANCAGMDPRDGMFIIMQVVRKVAAFRLNDLYYTDSIIGCGSSEDVGWNFCESQKPTLLKAVDDLARVIMDSGWFDHVDILIDKRLEVGLHVDLGGDIDSLNARQFQEFIGDLFERAKGEPIIDSRVPGVPSIDD